MLRSIGFLSLLFCMTAFGCTHLKGIVEDQRQSPVRSAVITIGRPDGIAVFDRHPVDDDGRFDFMIMSIDENNIYVYDSQSDAAMSAQHIDHSELGEKMKLRLGPAPKKEAPMIAPLNSY